MFGRAPRLLGLVSIAIGPARDRCPVRLWWTDGAFNWAPRLLGLVSMDIGLARDRFPVRLGRTDGVFTWAPRPLGLVPLSNLAGRPASESVNIDWMIDKMAAYLSHVLPSNDV